MEEWNAYRGSLNGVGGNLALMIVACRLGEWGGGKDDEGGASESVLEGLISGDDMLDGDWAEDVSS